MRALFVLIVETYGLFFEWETLIGKHSEQIVQSIGSFRRFGLIVFKTINVITFEFIKTYG
jgi:hypothetical protein